MKKRIKNPLFLAAAAGLLYQVANCISKKYAGVEIPLGDFKIAVDLIAYVAIGAGVYSTFE